MEWNYHWTQEEQKVVPTMRKYGKLLRERYERN